MIQPAAAGIDEVSRKNRSQYVVRKLECWCRPTKSHTAANEHKPASRIWALRISPCMSRFATAAIAMAKPTPPMAKTLGYDHHGISTASPINVGHVQSLP